jgi:hypothetical protein
MNKLSILFPVTLDTICDAMLEHGSGLRFEREVHNGAEFLIPATPRRDKSTCIGLDQNVMKAITFVSIGREGDINKAHNWNMYRTCGVVGLTTDGYVMKHDTFVGGGMVVGTPMLST